MAAVSRPVLIALYLVATSVLFGNTTGTKNYYVPWNTTNPIFQISNTDHIIDVNRGNSLFEYDQVTIICPVYNEWTREEDTEKYIIYNVSKEEYDTCRITDPNPRIIAVCDKPYKLMFFTITFRSFTPQPGGLEFRPGQDYFFISTSARGDMLRRIGGRCSTHNMKVVFKVCCNDTATINHIDTPLLDGPRDGQPGQEVPASVAPTWSVERRRTTTPTPTTRTPTTTRHSYKGVHDLYDLHVPSISVKNTKKSGVFDKTRHPNEQKPKKQGLTSSAPTPAQLRHPLTSLWSSLICFLLLRLAAR